MCPMCAPAVQPGRACCCNLHVNHAMLAPDQIDAIPSQREGQLDDEADYQIACQSARTVAVNGGRGCPIAASGPVHHPGRLLMAWKRSGLEASTWWARHPDPHDLELPSRPLV